MSDCTFFKYGIRWQLFFSKLFLFFCFFTHYVLEPQSQLSQSSIPVKVIATLSSFTQKVIPF